MEDGKEEKQYIMKVVLIGDSGVGKTTIINRYVSDTFDAYEPPTISGGFRKKAVKLPDKNAKVTLQIWDTAGQEKFKSIVGNYYKDAQCAIVMYDITSSESFEAAKNWIKEVQNTAPQDVIISIWGSKVDLEDQRQISFQKGYALANELGGLFGETSAKKNIYVSETFENIAKKFIESHAHKVQDIRRQTLSLEVNNKKKGKKGSGWKC